MYIAMETLTIELNNPRTFSLLKELEELTLLRIVKKQPKARSIANLRHSKKPSDFFGTLSASEGEEFHQYVAKSRYFIHHTD